MGLFLLCCLLVLLPAGERDGLGEGTEWRERWWHNSPGLGGDMVVRDQEARKGESTTDVCIPLPFMAILPAETMLVIIPITHRL